MKKCRVRWMCWGWMECMDDIVSGLPRTRA